MPIKQKQDARLQGRTPGFRGGGGVTGKLQDRGKTRDKTRQGQGNGQDRGRDLGVRDELVRGGGALRECKLRHLKA